MSDSSSDDGGFSSSDGSGTQSSDGSGTDRVLQVSYEVYTILLSLNYHIEFYFRKRKEYPRLVFPPIILPTLAII